MLKSNLVVTYEVSNRDFLVLLIHGVLLSLCQQGGCALFSFFFGHRACLCAVELVSLVDLSV
jgi:hypothetical protein